MVHKGIEEYIRIYNRHTVSMRCTQLFCPIIIFGQAGYPGFGGNNKISWTKLGKSAASKTWHPLWIDHALYHTHTSHSASLDLLPLEKGLDGFIIQQLN